MQVSDASSHFDEAGSVQSPLFPQPKHCPKLQNGVSVRWEQSWSTSHGEQVSDTVSHFEKEGIVQAALFVQAATHCPELQIGVSVR